MDIAVRLATVKDLDTLFRWELNPDVRLVSSHPLPPTRMELWDFLSQANNDLQSDSQLLYIITADDLPVGTVDIANYSPKTASATIGIYILPQYRQRGIALKALRLIEKDVRLHEKVKSLNANILESNIPSLCFFRKMGYSESLQRSSSPLHTYQKSLS